ncbi:hypothetical protein RB195_012299 [Necator americanus]|uniref:Uncharacterized protein n=2 Tax=Necator americanus TaxID=51031 RepID=A0ABR1D795_NECAM
MDSLRRFGSTVNEFWRGVVEWRSPASAPYLMLVNMAFWSIALYCSELVQLRLLLSLAAGVVGWDILLSPTHERSIATHVALWPVQSIWRTLSVCGCIYSSHQLQLQQLESACIAAYATVGCLLVSPVWNYYEVNQKIANGAICCGKMSANAAKVVIVHPLLQVYQVVKYVVLLQFVPPLWRCFKSGVIKIGIATKNGTNYVATGIKNGISYVVTSIKNGIVYVLSSIKNGVVYVVTAIKNGIIYIVVGIKNSIVATFNLIKNAIRATMNFFKNLFIRIRTWISMRIIEPTKNCIYAIGRWLRYWFCAHWWPDLKQWIKIRIGEPLRRAFNYFCYGLVYIVCGRWIPSLKTWLGSCLQTFRDFIVAQMRRLGGFLHRTIVVPTKNYFRRKFEEFRLWLRHFLHRVAVAIRDSILWPICVLVVDAGRELSLLMYRILLKPILDYFYQRYKIVETAILINFLGPVCDTIVKNIPEKSPFCDDSDVELEGMLPEEITEEIEHAVVEGSEGEDSLADLEPLSPLDEEEHDFHSGLAFPTIHASESSDDEFDLNVQRKEAKRRKRKERETADVGAAPEMPAPESSQRRRTGGAQSFDEEFELLQ